MESQAGGARVTGRWSRRQFGDRVATFSVVAGGVMLAACGSTAGTPTGSGDTGAAKPSAGPVTLRFHSRGGAPGSQEVTLYDERMPKFMERYPNIKVVHEGFTGENYPQKITVLGAGGSLGDSLWTAVLA